MRAAACDTLPMTVRQAIRESLKLLNHRDRRLLGVATIIQMATSLLDLVGVLLIGLVGAMSVTLVEGQPPPAIVETAFAAVGLGGMSPEAQIGILAATAAVVLLSKSIISPFLMARVLSFLARREAMVSARLTRELLSRPLTFVQQRSSQETAYALIQGTTQATINILGQTVVALSEIALLAVLGVALLLVNPAVALASIAFFALVALGLQRLLGVRMARFSEERATADIESLNAVQEALGAYREIIVSNRRGAYVARLEGLRRHAARAAAGMQLSALLPKFVFEAALVVGAFALAVVLLVTQPLAAALGTLALFLAAATRVMPSLLRLQSSTLALRGIAAAASRTFTLAQVLGHPLAEAQKLDSAHKLRVWLREGHADFDSSIEVDDVSFTYPESDVPAIHGVSLALGQGQSLALVGRTGAGKSTLADLILGVHAPQAGRVALGSQTPPEAAQRWPGAISYVPQEVLLANASVRANVALGLSRDAFEDEWVWEALHRAHLADYVATQPEGLDTEIGEHGLRLSGGQRQRLGIARALFTRPRLLVLDEATSALDAETEQAIADMVADVGAEVTTVVIAHRLSTIRHADIVAYLHEGKLVATGGFDEVCRDVPALRRQAQLMGLRHS